jgi:SAM-dependent methyltransferase
MTERSPEDWAAFLSRSWEERARHPSRDFFVASNPGWSDPERWDRQAQQELALFLTEIAPERLAGLDVLEIGCGSGRLAPFLAPRARSYTGFDIAPGMVEGARERAAGIANARFFVGDGLRVPEGAQDRTYGLAIAVAVFIHCPRSVIESNLRSVWSRLAPGGEVRVQVLGDPEDATGIEVAVAEATVTRLDEEVREVLSDIGEKELELTADPHYMGHRFRYDELRSVLTDLAATDDEDTADERIALYRADPFTIYGMARRSG